MPEGNFCSFKMNLRLVRFDPKFPLTIKDSANEIQKDDLYLVTKICETHTCVPKNKEGSTKSRGPKTNIKQYAKMFWESGSVGMEQLDNAHMKAWFHSRNLGMLNTKQVSRIKQFVSAC